MFLDDLITAMTADASVNSYATGGIRYKNFPISYDRAKTWIVFDYSANGNEGTFGHPNLDSEFDVAVEVSSSDITKVNILSDTLNDYIIDYDDGKIRIVSLVNDDMNYDNEDKVYYKNLDYNISYEN